MTDTELIVACKDYPEFPSIVFHSYNAQNNNNKFNFNLQINNSGRNSGMIQTSGTYNISYQLEEKDILVIFKDDPLNLAFMFYYHYDLDCRKNNAVFIENLKKLLTKEKLKNELAVKEEKKNNNKI